MKLFTLKGKEFHRKETNCVWVVRAVEFSDEALQEKIARGKSKQELREGMKRFRHDI